MLLEAASWLGLMRLAILLLPFRRLAALLRLSPGEDGLAPKPVEVDLARSIGWAVRVVAGRTPWQSACLVQALAGMVMLRRRGIGGTLYLGVAKEPDLPETLAAHAWLRCGAVVLTGANGYERYTVLSAFSPRRHRT